MPNCNFCGKPLGFFSTSDRICNNCRLLKASQEAAPPETVIASELQLPSDARVAVGENGIVIFHGGIVQILRRNSGFMTFINQGVQGDRYIIARTITAVAFLDPFDGRSGFISFEFAGKNPPRGGVFDALADENAVVFSSKQKNVFEEIRVKILEYLVEV